MSARNKSSWPSWGAKRSGRLAGYEEIQESAEALRRRTPRPPQVAIITGSGLGGLAEELKEPVSIPYAEIPHFPPASVEGHPGQLALGEWAGKRVGVLRGRVHYYEGASLQEVTLPVRVLRALGAELLIVTNAAGGLNPEFRAGDLMLITDHINWPGMAGLSPLRGPHDPRLGPRFLPTANAYDPQLRDLALEVAQQLGIELRQGVYIMLAGPTFESPAEVRFLRQIEADAVGMSTVPEVIVARHAGMRVLGISHISNLVSAKHERTQAQGLGGENLHQEVLAAGARAAPKLVALIGGVLERL